MFSAALSTTVLDPAIIPQNTSNEVGLVIVILVLIIKVLLDFFQNRKMVNEFSMNMPQKDAEKLQATVECVGKKIEKLYEMHNKFDEDGTPIWYIPRSWSVTQIEIIQTCQQISKTQEIIAKTLERIENNMERRISSIPH